VITQSIVGLRIDGRSRTFHKGMRLSRRKSQGLEVSMHHCGLMTQPVVKQCQGILESGIRFGLKTALCRSFKGLQRHIYLLDESLNMRKATDNSRNVLHVLGWVDLLHWNRSQCSQRFFYDSAFTGSQDRKNGVALRNQEKADGLQRAIADRLNQRSDRSLSSLLRCLSLSFLALCLSSLARAQMVGRKNCDNGADRLHPTRNVSAVFRHKGVGLNVEQNGDKPDGCEERHRTQYHSHGNRADIDVQFISPFPLARRHISAAGRAL